MYKQKHEYKVLQKGYYSNRQGLEDHMNSLAQEGWSLVGADDNMLYFEREFLGKEEPTSDVIEMEAGRAPGKTISGQPLSEEDFLKNVSVDLCTSKTTATGYSLKGRTGAFKKGK